MTAIDGPSLELQKAYVAILKNDADVVSLISTRINPVQGTDWPGDYIEIGDGQDVPDLAECIDGSEIYHDIHIWTRGDSSFAKVNKIAANVWKAISAATITLTENQFKQVERGSLNRLRDPNGVTLHGILTLRALTEPA